MSASTTALGVQVPGAPGPDLDPYLDAASELFARFGIKRTSVPDIAARLGVSRGTVYRRVGTVEDLAKLLLARELQALLTSVGSVEDISGPRDIARLLARIVSYARSHPVARKILNDEPDLVGPFLIRELPELVARVAAFARPFLDMAMEARVLARRDPDALAEWVVRITVSAVIAPPPGDLESFFAAVLEPVLAPPARR